MAYFHKQSSPYRETDIKNFYLDLWNAPELTEQDDDKLVMIAPEHHLRPDILAQQVYDTPGLFWVFWLRNKDIIIDPINDFTTGKNIIVPSRRYIIDTVLS